MVVGGLLGWATTAAADVWSAQQLVDESHRFPAGTQVSAWSRDGSIVRVDLDLGRPFDPREMDELVAAADHVLGAGEGVRGVYIRVPDHDGVFRPLPDLLPDLPVPDKGVPVPAGSPPHDHPGWADGALAGKTVYLSQCHGWYWHDGYESWLTQRGNVFDTVEDFHNPEGMNQYLMRYLLNAGARVMPVKESDLNEAMVIVDDADVGYEETGGAFSESSGAGFASGVAPYGYGVDPLEQGGSREAETATTASASARWIPEIPADGYYQVYASYRQDPSRAPDAHYMIHHPGGVTDVFVDQRIHGSTWVYLGRFYFYAGRDSAIGSVELANDSVSSGATISADAIRFGGGMGDVEREGAVSGHERWEEAAIYYTQFAGAPTTVYDPYSDGDGSDPSSRSRFADWEHEDGEDAVYFSWHSNACGSCGASGTSTYVYSECDVGYDCEFAGIEGSDVMAQYIQSAVVDTIDARWEPGWSDRGVRTAWFAEVNPDYNDEMPAALIELAFHDTESDTALLKHPRFRRDVSRAMMHGIIDYFADRDGETPHYPPGAPTHLSVRGGGSGELEIHWEAPPDGGGLGDPATSYRLYLSVDGRSFDGGVDVDGTTTTLQGPAGWEPLFVRVTAVNEGGESFPTPTLGAIPSPAEKGVLLVHGFDRLDRGQLLWRALGGDLGDVTHMDLDAMNRYDYAVEHLRALAAVQIPVDAVNAEVVADGRVTLDDYPLVIWAAGEESVEDESFSAAEQEQVRAYMDGGGRLLVSGSEIGWDLSAEGDSEDQAFYGEVLRAAILADDAGTYDVAAEPDGVFAGLGPLLIDDGSHGTYHVDYPDVLDVQPGASVEMLYAGQPSQPAALSADDGSLIYLGFPFETVVGEDDREALMIAAVAFLLPEYDPPDWDDDDDGLTVGPPLDRGCRCRTSGTGGVAPAVVLLLGLASVLLWNRVTDPRKDLR